MTSKVYSNVFSQNEIDLIRNFYDSKPVATEDYWSKNKNLEYHIPEDFSYRLLNPKLSGLIGQHEFATGAYKECINPYAAHVDTYEAHEQTHTITTFSDQTKHNMVMLIPLVQGPAFKTVTFKCYSTHHDFQQFPQEWQTDKNSLDPSEFSHEGRDLSHLPVDIEYTWTVGDILTWERNQLHISADFRRHGMTKKFLILFIA